MLLVAPKSTKGFSAWTTTMPTVTTVTTVTRKAAITSISQITPGKYPPGFPVDDVVVCVSTLIEPARGTIFETTSRSASALM